MNAWEISSLSKERHQREIPSFSSSLLDAIYRSIDEASVEDTKTKRHQNFILKDSESLRRDIMIEKWLDTETRIGKCRPYNSTSSSSGSSCEDSFPKPEGPKSTNFKMRENEKLRLEFLARTKVKAMKIYGDLKKQPVSPGRRLTKFINLFFSSKNTKRETDINCPFQKSRSVKETETRSCLSKMPSRSNSKRSVRFYPVAVNTVDEDSSGTFERKLVKNKMVLNKLNNKILLEAENGNDEDGMSCSSSDLFELENIGGSEELPVYGTTSLRINHAIANRLI